MNRLTFLLIFILLMASLTGCIEETTDEVTDPVDETDPPSSDETVNGSSGSGGTIPETGNGGNSDDNSGSPVNESSGGSGSSDGGSSSDNGGSESNTNETDSDDNDETDPESGTGEGNDPGDNGGTDPESGTGDGTSTGTTECGSGDGTYSSTMIGFDITANPDFTNIGGIEIDCSSNLLYGYAWDSVTEIEHFISIDPSNGMVTSLVELAGIEYVTDNTAFSDGEYYANMRGDATDYLVHVTVSTPSLYTKTAFDFTANPELDNVGGLEYNHADGIIYAYASDDSNSGSQSGQGQQNTITYPDIYVVSINPSDAVVTQHTQIEDIEGVGAGGSAFDGSHFYLSVRNSGGGYSMTKINVQDYSMTMSTVLTSTNEDLANPSGFEINLVDGLIYGYAKDSQTNEEVFLSYDIATESVVQIGVIDGVQYVTSFSTNGGNDLYAIMAGADRVSKLVHITY